MVEHGKRAIRAAGTDYPDDEGGISRRACLRYLNSHKLPLIPFPLIAL
jgi:hypothetical protein